MFVTNGYKKVVVVPQSMGAIYFLHFLKWVETPPPMGGGGGPGWCDKHIKAIMNISPEFLGVPKAVSNIFSAEGSDAAFVRLVLTIKSFISICLLYMKFEVVIWNCRNHLT
jgi:phospholipid:diacylglycerol acyltransferase